MSNKGSSVIQRLKKLHQQRLELDNETNQTVSSNKIRKDTNYRMKKSSAGVAINPLIPAASVPENVAPKKKIKNETDTNKIPTKIEKKPAANTKINQLKKIDKTSNNAEEDNAIQTIPYPTGKTNLANNPSMPEQSKYKPRTINQKIYEKRTSVNTKPIKKTIQEKAPEPHFAFEEKPTNQHGPVSNDLDVPDAPIDEGTFKMNITTNDSVRKKLFNPPTTKSSIAKKPITSKKAEKPQSIVKYSGFRSKNNQDDDVPSYDFKSKSIDSPVSKIRNEQVTEAYTRIVQPKPPQQEVITNKDDEFDSSDELIKKAATFLRKTKRIQTNAGRNLESIEKDSSTITEVKKEKVPFSWGNMLKESINESKVLLNNQTKKNSPVKSSTNLNQQENTKVQINHHQMIELSSDESDDLKFAFTPPKKPDNVNSSKRSDLPSDNDENDLEINESVNIKTKMAKSKIPKMVSKPTKREESNDMSNSNSIDEFLRLEQTQKENDSSDEEASSPKNKLMSLMQQKLSNVLNSDSNDISSSSDITKIPKASNNMNIPSDESESDDIIAKIDNKLKETNNLDKRKQSIDDKYNFATNKSGQRTSVKTYMNVSDDDSSDSSNNLPNKPTQSPIEQFKSLRDSVIEVLNKNSDDDAFSTKTKSPLSPKRKFPIHIDDDSDNLSPVEKPPPQPESYPTDFEVKSKRINDSDSIDEDGQLENFVPKTTIDQHNDLSSDSLNENNDFCNSSNKQQEIPVPSFISDDNNENDLPIDSKSPKSVTTAPPKQSSPLRLSPTVSVSYFSNKNVDNIPLQSSIIDEDEGADFTQIDINEKEEEVLSDDSFTEKLKFAKNKISSIHEAKQSKLSSSLLKDETDKSTKQEVELNDALLNSSKLSGANNTNEIEMFTKETRIVQNNANSTNKIEPFTKETKIFKNIDKSTNEIEAFTEETKIIKNEIEYGVEETNSKSEDRNSFFEEENEADENEEPIDPFFLNDDIFNKEEELEQMLIQEYSPKKETPQNSSPQLSNKANEINQNYSELQKKLDGISFSLQYEEKIDNINNDDEKYESDNDLVQNLSDGEPLYDKKSPLSKTATIPNNFNIRNENQKSFSKSFDKNDMKDFLNDQANTKEEESEEEDEILIRLTNLTAKMDQSIHNLSKHNDEEESDNENLNNLGQFDQNDLNNSTDEEDINNLHYFKFKNQLNHNVINEEESDNDNLDNFEPKNQFKSDDLKSSTDDDQLNSPFNIAAVNQKEIINQNSVKEIEQEELNDQNKQSLEIEKKLHAVNINDNNTIEEEEEDIDDVLPAINNKNIQENNIYADSKSNIKSNSIDDSINGDSTLIEEEEEDIDEINSKSSVKNDQLSKQNVKDFPLNKNVEKVDLLNIRSQEYSHTSNQSENSKSADSNSKDSFAFEFLKQEDFIGDSFKPIIKNNSGQKVVLTNSSIATQNKKNLSVDLIQSIETAHTDDSEEEDHNNPNITNEEDQIDLNIEKDDDDIEFKDIENDILKRIQAYGNTEDKYTDGSDSDDEFLRRIAQEKDIAPIHNVNNEFQEEENKQTNEDDENGMTQTQIDLDDLSKTEISKLPFENKEADDIDIEDMNVLQASQKANAINDLSDSEDDDFEDDELLQKKIQEFINRSLSDDDSDDLDEDEILKLTT